MKEYHQRLEEDISQDFNGGSVSDWKEKEYLLLSMLGGLEGLACELLQATCSVWITDKVRQSEESDHKKNKGTQDSVTDLLIVKQMKWIGHLKQMIMGQLQMCYFK